MKRELERIEIPGEHEARERSWAVVEAAFAGHEPRPRRRSWKPVAAIVIALVALAGLLSPAGRAVLGEFRQAVGVEQAQPALFSLPAAGSLLVTADSGAWVVEQDGSKRLLGSYREASWSPFGRFVVASRPNELAALTPEGEVRWSLARPAVRFPRWTGKRLDTRIAYASGNEARVVGGDGRGDRLLFSVPDAAAVPMAWRPGSRRILAHVTQGILRVLDLDTGGAELWSADVGRVHRLDWSDDGRRLLALGDRQLFVFDGAGRRLEKRRLPGLGLSAAFRPRERTVALVLGYEGRSDVLVGGRRVFSGAGVFTELAWSPDGRWLLMAWLAADQWVFVRPARGEPRIVAVSNVSTQFRSRSFPRVEGWCCAG